MKKTITTLAAITLGFGFSACDSKQENARDKAIENKADQLDDKADAVRERSKQDAAAIKDGAEARHENNEKAVDAHQKSANKIVDADKKAADASADHLKAQGEKIADGLENKAGAVREQK